MLEAWPLLARILLNPTPYTFEKGPLFKRVPYIIWPAEKTCGENEHEQGKISFYGSSPGT